MDVYMTEYLLNTLHNSSLMSSCLMILYKEVKWIYMIIYSYSPAICEIKYFINRNLHSFPLGYHVGIAEVFYSVNF